VERLVRALADHDLHAQDVTGEPGDVQCVGPVPGAWRVRCSSR